MPQTIWNGAPRLAAALLMAFTLVLSSIQAHATTVIAIVGDQGISIAADSKMVILGAYRDGERETVKSFIIQDRLVIASLGYSANKWTDPAGGVVIDYEFEAWLRGIQAGLPANVSFDDFVGIVKEGVRKMIPKWQAMVTAGKMPHKHYGDIFESLTQYVIAGYKDGVPTLSSIEFYVDWDKNEVLGPYQVALAPSRAAVAGRTYTYFFGVTEVAFEAPNPQSYAYKQAMALSPKAFGDLMGGREFPLNESNALARALVKIEEQTNPHLVGGKVRVVEIAPTGKAREVIEEPPKTKPEKQNEPGGPAT
jgi:hypothetical protein